MWTKLKAIIPIECLACHKMIEIGQTVINHHISYFPEKVIQVHNACHNHIHKSESRYPELVPDARQVIRWYRKLGKRFRIDCFYFQFVWFMNSIESNSGIRI